MTAQSNLIAGEQYQEFEGHTPGPWQTSGSKGQFIQAAGGVDTCFGPVWGCIATAEKLRESDSEGREWTAPGTMEANARLIAAAPSLLSDHKRMSAEIEKLREALEGLVKINEEHNAAMTAIIGRPLGWKDDYLDKARAALASSSADGSPVENHER